MKITVSYERELLGTAGTLIKNINFFKNSSGIVLHADNMTDDNLQNSFETQIKKQ